MAQPPHQIRFVEAPTLRAKPIPHSKWDEHKEELCSLYQTQTLDELMVHMKDRYGFQPSRRQYIFQLGKWKAKKYNTLSGRDVPQLQIPHGPRRPRQPLSVSASGRSTPTYAARAAPPVAPKRPKSMASLQSRDSVRSSMDGRPAVPPKKRQKLALYMASRESLASLGLQFASTGQPTSSDTSPLAAGSPQSLHSNNIDEGTNTLSNTPGLVEDDSDWMTDQDYSDSDLLLPDGSNDFDMRNGKMPSSQSTAGRSSLRRRRFDSSRPIHTFSQEELVDMKMAAHFLRSLGFDSDAFELFTILLKHLKEPSLQPSWMKASALISCVRSAYWLPQMDIARNELLKTLDEPRDASTDAEHFLYRMLLAETYTRSDEKDHEDFLSEMTIGCELVSDKMLDRLPDEHRCYDILTYHYLNKCLEYLNAFVKDPSDEGTVFTDKEHLQIRLMERIPGPFELRRGTMGNPCLRSCLQWCGKQLRTVLTSPDSWKDLQSNDMNYIYWTDHIGLYCALWERWQSQRRDCLGSSMDLWMFQTESRMGITSAELLSVTCGLIMSAAPPRLQTGATLTVRARTGLQSVYRLTDKDLGCQFLDTFSLLGTLLGSAPQRQYHDPVSFFATLINSTREREAFSDRARAFSRGFIERDLNIILPNVQRDIESPTRRDTQALSLLLSGSAISMENFATAISPFFASSIHSSDLSAMQSLRDRIQQATRRSIDRAMVAPSTVGRAASRSYVSIPTVSEISAMTSTLSLSSTQAAANATLDAIAATSRDVRELFAGLDGNFFEVNMR
ncbi:hypothetical protein K505DRAFT_310038 [Melanomma pulvis-pyrius CBS 109.77]|uniref:Clr5 domain-containing protein n=1 Tax=Melanomma pulvis-pyrius CBS 109.77 TaxID=1314802 RepID=A0A6A6X4E8_9PLEO|nr:hypothetical protein K505DRAFT_310038 [Melanomma pulvis-pyrius CBS 109.77]